MSTLALKLSGVTKTYPGVVALKNATFEVLPGEVHALVGENGAGKSTLMGVASGSTLLDSGSVEIAGKPLDPPSPQLAERLGLAIAYQRPALVPDLTVAELAEFVRLARQCEVGIASGAIVHPDVYDPIPYEEKSLEGIHRSQEHLRPILERRGLAQPQQAMAGVN